jgi:1,4-dihydroxy-2-naphthoate octaprenyltransferase
MIDLVGSPRGMAAILLAPAGLALLVLPVAFLVDGPPFGVILYVLIILAAMTTLPGLVCLYLAIRQARRGRSNHPQREQVPTNPR